MWVALEARQPVAPPPPALTVEVLAVHQMAVRAAAALLAHLVTAVRALLGPHTITAAAVVAQAIRPLGMPVLPGGREVLAVLQGVAPPVERVVVLAVQARTAQPGMAAAVVVVAPGCPVPLQARAVPATTSATTLKGPAAVVAAVAASTTLVLVAQAAISAAAVVVELQQPATAQTV